MKLMHFAIASLVDAHRTHETNGHHDTAATAPHGRRQARAGNVVRSVRAVVATVRAAVARVRERRSGRAALAALERLDDRALHDIGLRRGDLDAVRMGATTLAALNDERERARAPAPRALATIHRISAEDASNEEGTEEFAKCA